ncbi:ferritin-like domain-containing protein [Streptodolium elevatio]|uniref:Ferritin-like domain-containing protein n=1 Tax=Streptodolium elevatio TaxID=3157996 RepID=A0ABV3DQ87_9ACTN
MQAAPADMLDLSMTTKQAHWSIHGRGLFAVHTHLDEIAARARDLDDDLAERAAAGGRRGTRAHRRVGVVEVRGGDLVPQPRHNTAARRPACAGTSRTRPARAPAVAGGWRSPPCPAGLPR